MKRYLVLSCIFAALSACGGSGGGEGAVVGGSDGESPAGPVVLGHSPVESRAAMQDIASHEAAFGNTAPILGRGTSQRFDEDGYLIGIYEISDAPSEGGK